MTQIKHTFAAADDVIAAGQTQGQSLEAQRDEVEQANRAVGNLLQDGAGSQEVAATHRQAFERFTEAHDAMTQQSSTDRQTQDINHQAVPRMQNFFGNRA